MKMKKLLLVMLALLCIVLTGCKNEQKEISLIESHDPILCDIAAEPKIYVNMSSEDFISLCVKEYGDLDKNVSNCPASGDSGESGENNTEKLSGN